MPELGFELGSCGERVVSECVSACTLWFGYFLLVFVRGRLRFGFADVIERESGRTLTTRRCETKPEVPEYVWFGCRGVVRTGFFGEERLGTRQTRASPLTWVQTRQGQSV